MCKQKSPLFCCDILEYFCDATKFITFCCLKIISSSFPTLRSLLRNIKEKYHSAERRYPSFPFSGKENKENYVIIYLAVLQNFNCYVLH